MSSMFVVLAALSLAAWIWLLLFHGMFWRIREHLDDAPAPSEPAAWPTVVAICPARNEAAVIAPAILSLLSQDYPGRFHVILVDDSSEDGTAEVAAASADARDKADRLDIVRAPAPPPGWAGKLWALQRGIEAARASEPEAPWLWFSDADIVASPTILRRLVAKARRDDLDLASLMVELSCRSFWERLLIPPFVFFFRKLYPFARVNDPRNPTAAAAGGCMLVRREALERAGGIERVRGALIDDCTLAGLIKREGRAEGGRIWLGQTRSSRSIRPYEGIAGIWRMVARSAYTQLRHSPLLLIGTLLGMFVIYLVPPLTVLLLPLHGDALAVALALAAWLAMSAAFWPTLRFYGQPDWVAPLLPIAASLYSAMTVDSALDHWRGRGGRWKGRVEASPADLAGPCSRG